MKFAAKVVKHEMVRKGDATLLKIGLKGVDLAGLKIELLVEESDRAKYPFGSGCVVDFNVQQSMALER